MSLNVRILAVLTLVMCVLIAGVVDWRVGSSKPSPKVSVTTPTQTPSPTPVPDPLTIAAIAARTYTASPISAVQDLGEQGGYRDQIASYQSDGLKIYALISAPDGAAPAAGWPVVVLNHGYIDPSQYQTDGTQYKPVEAALAKAGYVVIKPDYRGNGNSEGTPEGGHFSPVYTYDLLNLIASIKADKRYDAKRIGLFAHSMGSDEALRAIVVSKDIKATVFVAGVVGSFDDIIDHWPGSQSLSDKPAIVQTIRQNLIAKYGTPQQNPSFWNSASAINYVKNITGAVQVNQDISDSIVPKLFADHLVAALQQAGKPVEYQTYPGDDHQFTANRVALAQNMLAFYKARL